jgi:hypothetical protein
MSHHTRHDHALTIRRALPADETALARLAVLDSSQDLRGEVIVAEVAGEVWAARSLADGRVLRDPFRPTSEAAALLELRATYLRRDMTLRGGRIRLRATRRASSPA